MFVKQVSIFVDNKLGSIAEVISSLSEDNINIKALSVADAADYGILRLIVDEPEKAFNIIKEKGYDAKIAYTIGISINDKANALSEVLNLLKKNGISVTYIYSFLGYMENQAVCIIKTPDLDKTLKLLLDNNIELVNPKMIYEE